MSELEVETYKKEVVVEPVAAEEIEEVHDEESDNIMPILGINRRFTNPLPLKTIKVHSTKLNLDFTVYVQDETSPSQQRCYIMTLHDLGCDHTSFQEFISCHEMRGLKDRIIWIHVDLPGQEANAADLSIAKYPSLVELAQELVIILDELKISHVTCLGDGCGANLAARFAMKHPNRCMGVALIHPTGSAASFMEHLKDKLSSWLPNKNTPAAPVTGSSGSGAAAGGITSSAAEAYLIWHRFGNSNQTDHLIQSNIKEFQSKLSAQRNAKNLSLLIEAYLNRSNITEKLDELKSDVMIAVGKKAALANGTKKFYKALYESRKTNRQLLVNCPLLEIEEVGDIMGETPDRLALPLQFFLQGAGLLTAMPMKNALKGLGRLSRAFSMEDADKPRRASFVDTGDNSGSTTVH